MKGSDAEVMSKIVSQKEIDSHIKDLGLEKLK